MRNIALIFWYIIGVFAAENLMVKHFCKGKLRPLILNFFSLICSGCALITRVLKAPSHPEELSEKLTLSYHSYRQRNI